MSVIVMNVVLVILLGVAMWLLKTVSRIENHYFMASQDWLKDTANDSETTPHANNPGTVAKNIKPFITVEVTNAFSLAERESKLAPYIAKIAPSLIQEKVYEQVVENMRIELDKEGVEHKVQLLYR
ncbi:hypothetical protein OLMES_5255 [Oleiphilus messinensis]|uniref:Uncharacterized protein n=1 Tax=Oleiphilus messinensis TaxID=141451 RepID=A0A1Y0IGK1_9GAMM|nr:hypothetical protein [Oleiphilus messinensis]ARU59239.1 hypothetical protein OLMES_5255 [Oleiphilus messinensis]